MNERENHKKTPAMEFLFKRQIATYQERTSQESHILSCKICEIFQNNSF